MKTSANVWLAHILFLLSDVYWKNQSLLTNKRVLQDEIWEEGVRDVLPTIYAVFHKTLPKW